MGAANRRRCAGASQKRRLKTGIRLIYMGFFMCVNASLNTAGLELKKGQPKKPAHPHAWLAV